MRNAHETALLLALLIKRSGERRIRVSEATVKQLSQRQHQRLRSTFIAELAGVLVSDFAVCLVELDSGGGFGLLYVKSLEAAKACTVERLLGGECIGEVAGSFTPRQLSALRAELEGE